MAGEKFSAGQRLVRHFSPGSPAGFQPIRAVLHKLAESARAAGLGQRLARCIHDQGADLADRRKQVLDGLNTVGGETGRGFGRWSFACARGSRRVAVQQSFDFLAGETPLRADLDALEAAVLQHAVDRNAIYFENILYLSGSENIIHNVIVCYIIRIHRS